MNKHVSNFAADGPLDAKTLGANIMKRISILLFALAVGLNAQTPIGDVSAISGAVIDLSTASKVMVKYGTADASSGDCDASAEKGSLYVQTGDPASVSFRVSVCRQKGASTYGWDPIGVGVGPTLPATCGTGELWFDSDATAGSNLFGCTAANTWTALGGGGSGGRVHSFHYGPGTSPVTASSIIWGMGGFFVSNATQTPRAIALVPLDTGETCSVSNLRVGTYTSATTLNLAAGTLQVDVAINGTASAVTCTVGTGSSSCSDLTNTATVSAGDYVSFKFTSGAYSTAPYVVASFDCRQ